MLRDVIEAVEDGDDPFVDLRVKPALLTLLVDQAELLDASVRGSRDADLRSGFENRRELIEWYQRATVRTLGHIADEWPPVDCWDDTVMLAALVDGGTRNIDPFPERKATLHRQMIEATAVIPACNRAYKALRDSAVEYVKADEEGEEWSRNELDPSRQANVAMRPGFQTLDREQQRALDEWWGGFDDTDALLDWLHSLNSPTNGEVDDDLPEQFLADGVAMDHLVYNPDTAAAKQYREFLAATVILPYFVDGVRSMEAQELAKTTQDGAQTLRQRATHE